MGVRMCVSVCFVCLCVFAFQQPRVFVCVWIHVYICVCVHQLPDPQDLLPPTRLEFSMWMCAAPPSPGLLVWRGRKCVTVVKGRFTLLSHTSRYLYIACLVKCLCMCVGGGGGFIVFSTPLRCSFCLLFTRASISPFSSLLFPAWRSFPPPNFPLSFLVMVSPEYDVSTSMHWKVDPPDSG